MTDRFHSKVAAALEEDRAEIAQTVQEMRRAWDESMTPTPMTYLDLYEPGTIVRLKNGSVFTAGKFWPELPGVDLMADGKRLLTVSECWLKENVESIRFPQVTA